MPASTRFLAPHPPNLFHVTESQAFSGSSASFSSSTSSATSAFFDRLSRASSASAYLTDLTPPITPSHSNFDVERRQGVQQSKLSKDDPAAQQESTPKDSRHHLVRSILRLDEDDGYRSDDELEGGGFDAVDALRTRLRRSKQTINSRRALKIMERRDTLLSPVENADDDGPVGTASPPMEVVITEAQQNPVEDWSGDFELTAHQDSQAKSHASSDASESQWDERSRIDGSVTHIWPIQPYVECDDSVHEPLVEKDVVQSSQNAAFSPVMPPKPTIQPMDLDWECSPFSLCSPALSSPSSTSRMLESPLQLDATGTMSSPAIYNSSVIGSHSPFNSPLATISNLMFSSRIRHVPEALTGEDLAIADLMRLEISSTQVRAESTPITQTSSHLRLPVGLGFEIPSPTSQSSITVLQPPQYEARGTLSASSSNGENLIDFENSPVFSDYEQLSEMLLDIPLDGDLMVDKATAQLVSPLGVGEIHVEVVEEKIISNERSENAGREFVGLGLEGLAGGSLQSSGSISRLYLVPSPSVGELSRDRAMKGSGFDNILNGQYRSPGIKDRSEDMSYSGLIPSSALLESVNASDFNLDHMSVSPVQTEFLIPPPHEAQPHENIPDAFSDHNINTRKSPGIEQPHALLEEKRRLRRSSQRIVPASCIGLVGAKVPMRYSSVYSGRSPTESSPMLLTPENDPRSPCSPTEDYFGKENLGMLNSRSQSAEGVNSQNHQPFASASPFVVSSGVADKEWSGEPADPILRPGMGLPFNAANQHGGHENMASAEECMDLSALACASPPPHDQQEDMAVNSSFEASKDSIRSAMFAKRRLYDIPELLTPPVVHETPASTPSSSRLLSPAWPNLGMFNRLSPSRSTHSWISSDTNSRACGFPASTNTRGDRSPINTGLCPPLKMTTSTLPLPPTPPAHKIRLSWMSRSPLLGSSFSGPNSNSSPFEACSTSGVTSPAVIEHRHAPQGMGLFRRNNSSPSPKAVRKVNRFKPVIRKLQLLF